MLYFLYFKVVFKYTLSVTKKMENMAFIKLFIFVSSQLKTISHYAKNFIFTQNYINYSPLKKEKNCQGNFKHPAHPQTIHKTSQIK